MSQIALLSVGGGMAVAVLGGAAGFVLSALVGNGVAAGLTLFRLCPMRWLQTYERPCKPVATLPPEVDSGEEGKQHDATAHQDGLPMPDGTVARTRPGRG